MDFTIKSQSRFICLMAAFYILLELLFPMITVGFNLLFFENLAKYRRVRYATGVVNLLYVGFAVCHPPTSIPALKYLVGLVAAFHFVRSLEVLLVFDPLSVKRLRKVGSRYIWESLPPPYSIRRLAWVVDLLASPRAVGWSHSTARYFPPPDQIVDNKDLRPPLKPLNMRGPGRLWFLWKQVQRLGISLLWFDLYFAVFDHGNGITGKMIIDDIAIKTIQAPLSEDVHAWIARVAWVLCLPFSFDACYTFLALVAVGILTENVIGTAGEPWAWPVLFGGFRLSKPSIQDFWANWWHDLLLHPFGSVAMWFISPVGGIKLCIWTIFLLSGLAHGVGSYTAHPLTWPAVYVTIAFVAQPVAAEFQKRSIRWLSKYCGKSIAGSAIVWIAEWTIFIGWIAIFLPWMFENPSEELPATFLQIPHSRLRLSSLLFSRYSQNIHNGVS